MDSLSRSSPAGEGRDGGATPLAPPPAHVALLDASGVIVAADDRWAGAARIGQSGLGALGSVGDRYHDACEARARVQPVGRDDLLRLAESVRAVLAGGAEASFGYGSEGHTYAARIIPVRGAGADHTLVALVETTDYPGGIATRELRRRFETLFDSLDVGVMMEDGEGRTLAWNRSAERLLGLTADQMAGRAPVDPRWSLLHEDGWPLPRDDRPARVAMRTRRPCRDVVVGVKHPEGRVTWISVNAHPLAREGEDRPYAVGLSIDDVTDARAAQVADRRSADRFRSLIEYSSDVISILDARGRVSYESPSIERVLGYEVGEADDAARLALIHPDDLGATLDAVRGLQGRPGASVSYEHRIRARDGSWRILESVATNRLHDPSVVGTVINTRDITERREAEAALRATTSRLQNLVQNLHAGVLVEDEERRIVVVNSDFCALFGIEADPAVLLGVPCAEAVGVPQVVHDPQRYAARLDELVAAREPVHGEEVVFADGRTLERDYIPVASGHLWILRDITRRKQEQLEAARLRDEAIRASRLKSEFLATMSHEIKTPMNGVVGTIELLLDTDLEPHQRELAGLVRDSAFGLLSIVDDALDLSKIEAEKLEPREIEFELAAVAEGVADVVLSAARRKGLTLSVYVDPRISPRLFGDPQWLRQVLVNIAGNAMKFTDRGEVRIRADLEAQTPRSTTVRFAVTDTGIGIPEDQRDRLFEPFVQLDSSTTRRHGGTGLGLAICQRLVRLMGGELEVQSEPGAGSTFAFSLTLRPASGQEPRRATAGATRGLRVLVAEPRDAVAAIAAEYLSAWGIEAERASSTADAREHAAAAVRDGRPFDVAIVGIGPPQAAAHVGAALREAPGCEPMALVLLKDMGAPAGEADSPFASELTRPLKQAALYEAVVGAARPDALGAAVADADGEPVVARLPAGVRVLVAEDNEVNRELLVRQLAKLGAMSVAVASGAEALNAVRSRTYDAVLMDVHMPDVDGLQAAEAIRALGGERGATPIVAVTASGSPVEREACAAAGMDGFLAKPITSRDLARALAEVLGRPRPGAATQAPPAIDPAAVDRLDEDIGDRVELRRIAGVYLDQLGPGVRAMQAAIADGDSEGLERGAHRLGSASATFGACRLAELCDRLEALGAAGRAAAADDVAGPLEVERERAAAELRRLLEIET